MYRSVNAATKGHAPWTPSPLTRSGSSTNRKATAPSPLSKWNADQRSDYRRGYADAQAGKLGPDPRAGLPLEGEAALAKLAPATALEVATTLAAAILDAEGRSRRHEAQRALGEYCIAWGRIHGELAADELEAAARQAARQASEERNAAAIAAGEAARQAAADAQRAAVVGKKLAARVAARELEAAAAPAAAGGEDLELSAPVVRVREVAQRQPKKAAAPARLTDEEALQVVCHCCKAEAGQECSGGKGGSGKRFHARRYEAPAAAAAAPVVVLDAAPAPVVVDPGEAPAGDPAAGWAEGVEVVNGAGYRHKLYMRAGEGWDALALTGPNADRIVPIRPGGSWRLAVLEPASILTGAELEAALAAAPGELDTPAPASGDDAWAGAESFAYAHDGAAAEVRVLETYPGWLSAASCTLSGGGFGQAYTLDGPFYPDRMAALRAGLEAIRDRVAEVAAGRRNTTGAATGRQVTQAKRILKWAAAVPGDAMVVAAIAKSRADLAPRLGGELANARTAGPGDLVRWRGTVGEGYRRELDIREARVISREKGGLMVMDGGQVRKLGFDTPGLEVVERAPEGPAAAALSSERLIEVPVRKVAASKFQPRRDFPPAALRELGADIKANGLIEPIIVRTYHGPGDYTHELIAGERRLRAAQAAGLATLTAIDRGEVADREACSAVVRENALRSDLNAVEEARALSGALAQGWTQADVGALFGKKQQWVSARLRLLSLPESVQDLVAAGKLFPSQAEALARFSEHPEVVQAMAREAVKPGSSVRDLETALPFEPALRREGVVRSLAEGMGVQFDVHEVCSGCKHYLNKGRYQRWCLAPAEFEVHQTEGKARAEALAAEQAAALAAARQAAEVEAARRRAELEATRAKLLKAGHSEEAVSGAVQAAGLQEVQGEAIAPAAAPDAGAPVKWGQLPPGSFVVISPTTETTGCDGPHTWIEGADGAPRLVCLDREKHEKALAADRAAEERRKIAAAEAAYQAAMVALESEPLSSRGLALLVSHLFSTKTEWTLQRAFEALGVQLDPKVFFAHRVGGQWDGYTTARQLLAAMEPADLLSLALGVHFWTERLVRVEQGRVTEFPAGSAWSDWFISAPEADGEACAHCLLPIAAAEVAEVQGAAVHPSCVQAFSVAHPDAGADLGELAADRAEVRAVFEVAGDAAVALEPEELEEEGAGLELAPVHTAAGALREIREAVGLDPDGPGFDPTAPALFPAGVLDTSRPAAVTFVTAGAAEAEALTPTGRRRGRSRTA
jgi:ParB family chromosome partitioning protein